jgi:predicted membrane-bound spermidine synthase
MISTKTSLTTLIARVRAGFSDLSWLIYTLVFFTGCTALIYQFMWQRMLSPLFGFNLHSALIIVAVFLGGIAIGGLIGGFVADRYSERLRGIFVILQFCLAGYGFVSADIVSLVGILIARFGIWFTLLSSVVILAIPTILIGATLPLMAKQLNASNHHIGFTVSTLYLMGVLGAIVGAYASGFVLLYSTGVSGAINIAAVLNLFIALIANIYFRRDE